MRLRSAQNPEEQLDLVEGPTRYRRGANQSELVCGFCGDTFFVDDVTFHQAMSAMEEGIDDPFCCEECEEDYEDVSH
jgi:hypothetical protein